MSVLRSEKMASEINSIVVRYMSWIAQMVRALAQKAKGLGSSSIQDRIFLFQFYI